MQNYGHQSASESNTKVSGAPLDLLDPNTRSISPRKCYHELVLLRYFLCRLKPAIWFELLGAFKEIFVVVDMVDRHADTGTFWDEPSIGKFDTARWNKTGGAGGCRRCVAQTFLYHSGLDEKMYLSPLKT